MWRMAPRLPHSSQKANKEQRVFFLFRPRFSKHSPPHVKHHEYDQHLQHPLQPSFKTTDCADLTPFFEHQKSSENSNNNTKRPITHSKKHEAHNDTTNDNSNTPTKTHQKHNNSRIKALKPLSVIDAP
jgi:hypothetical protein